MSKPIFTADEFKDICTRQDMADYCNARIEKLLGPEERLIIMSSGHFERCHNDEFATHRARLFGVEEIEKRECEHHPGMIELTGTDSGRFVETICTKCLRKLRARWEAE